MKAKTHSTIETILFCAVVILLVLIVCGGWRMQ